MRPCRACWIVLGVLWSTLAVRAGSAAAQDICAPGGPSTLGVSRIVEIDTATGPRLGSQYHEHDILEDGEVVLTFDDGPLRAYSKLVLDALDAQCTKATFFVVGRMAVADPDMVQEYARRGHTVGAHTWSHANLAHLTPLRARAEIELGFSAVQRAMGKPIAPFFRFPYLSHPTSSAMYLQGRQIATISIDIDSKDYRTRNPAAVHSKVMSDLAHLKKGIVLFHDIQPSTAHALPGLLADLKAKGYRVVHLRPKSNATTVADYDAIALQELAKKQAAATERPLLRRSLTWPPATLAVQSAAAPSAGQAPNGQPSSSSSVQSATGRVRRQDDWGTTFWRLY
jgi:peptidoglycan-N-acetylglucosamine deacetylase